MQSYHQSIILVNELQVILHLIKLVKLQIIGYTLRFFYCILEMHWELLNFYVIYGYICTYTSKNDYLQLKHSCHIVFIQISIATCPVRVIKMWLRYRLSVIYVHFYQIFSSSIFEIGIFFRSYFFLLLKLFLSYHYFIIRLIKFFLIISQFHCFLQIEFKNQVFFCCNIHTLSTVSNRYKYNSFFPFDYSQENR